MHEAFSAYIALGQSLAVGNKLDWAFRLAADGTSKTGWNLTEAVGGTPPPTHYLRDLGHDDKALSAVNRRRTERGLVPLIKASLSQGWQDLIKAATCDQLFFRRNTTANAVQNVIRPLRVLATCADGLEPWQLTADAARLAVEIATEIQESGKLADLVVGTIKNIIDANHLATACPLYPTLSITRMPGPSRKSRFAKSKDELLTDLAERKRSEKLPERRAFWELVRIVFTEQPTSYADILRFAALKLMVITGLRIGEAVMLPADWRRTRDYFDPSGKPAGELGGYSSSLMLRHFAEKQQSQNSDSMVLYERTQYVPSMFENVLTETLDNVRTVTQPLRDTLKLQMESGRLLPWYQSNDLVPIFELYTRITGNPFWLELPAEKADDFVARYRADYSPEVLHELDRYQRAQYMEPSSKIPLAFSMYMYFNRIINRAKGEIPALSIRYKNGSEFGAKRIDWNQAYLRVGELEDFLISTTPTKLSDRIPFRLDPGEIQPWELLFLTPKRALSEARNNGIADVTRYFAVGSPDTAFLTVALGEKKHGQESLFARYGLTDEDRALVLTSHSLRHLQNTELFRLGVADTIITKRFNRRGVTQSYEYDHRSLAEKLDQIEIPPEIEIELGEKATTLAKLIKAGKANGPIVERFRKIQREAGEAEAFHFLKAEADGFHATPYGHCINSFTVDPCPKNLECFAGCNHLTATDLPDNRRHLELLEQKFGAALSEAESRPASTVGRKNQIAHATIRLESVRKLLTARPGEQVFPDGPDLSKQETPRRSVL